MSHQVNRLIRILSRNKKELFILLVIIAISSFFRLYRISDYLHFLGDEGRDVLVVKRIIIDHKFTLLGPITSVGSMYLGPIYYYFMLPFLYFFGMDPTGPAVMIAILSLATICLLYIFCLEFFNLPIAIMASILYGFSPFVIQHSRFSWNPNAVPFFALLIIYSLAKLLIKKQTNWVWVTGLSLGIILQLHYLALVFLPIIFLCLLVLRKLNISNIVRLVLGTAISLSPFIVFEIRKGFPNTQTAFRFITQSGSKANFGLSKFFFFLYDLTIRTVWRLVVIENDKISKFYILTAIIALIFVLFKSAKYKFRPVLAVSLIWYIVSILMLAFYQGAVYDYYFVIIFPVPALLLAVTLYWFWQKGGLIKYLSLAAFLYLVFLQLKHSPLLSEPNRLLAITKNRAKLVFDLVGNNRYNFAIASTSNSDHAYRYFLELWGKPPVVIENPTIDPDRRTVTNQLFVICEIKDCVLLGNPLWEIAGFGQAEIDNSWQVEGAVIYKLKHFDG